MSNHAVRLFAFLSFSLVVLTSGILPANADSGKCGDWDIAMLAAMHANQDFAMFPVYPQDTNDDMRVYIVEFFNHPGFQVNGSVTWNGLSWNTFTCYCHEEYGCEYSHDTNPGTLGTVYWNDSGGCTTTGIYDEHQNLQDPETWNCEDLGHPPNCY